MMIAKYMDITLRDFEEADIPKKVEWINNPANNRFLHYDYPLREDKTVQWFRHKDNSKRLDCIIEYCGIPVGLIGLLQIDRLNSKAEYYITIGETQYKNKGIATKATRAILEYAFLTLNLHKVYLTVDARNELAIKLYKKAGFVLEGYFVDDLYHSASSEFIDRERYAIVQNYGGTLCLSITKEFLFGRSKISDTIIQKVDDVSLCNHLYIKRDDLIPVSFGGNKARKALNFFKEIDEGSYDHVITYGSSSSNHCRIISNMAAARNLPCTIIGPEEASEPTFNSKMMELFGAEIIAVPVNQVHDTIENKLQQLRNVGKKPYFIQGGGHGNLGTQAYVDCYEEIRQYELGNGIYFDYIFFASGTGTTQAGLVCGQLIHHDDRALVGISIARKNPRGRQVILDSVHEYLEEHKFPVPEDEIEKKTIFSDDFTGMGYGKEDPDIRETIQEMFVKHGIPLDSTYTGKAYTGMKKYLRQEQINGKNILFIHTGGTPLFFDYLKKEG